MNIEIKISKKPVDYKKAVIFMEKRLDKNPGYLIDQTFYTVENTREDSWTDDSYMTQFEREK